MCGVSKVLLIIRKSFISLLLLAVGIIAPISTVVQASSLTINKGGESIDSKDKLNSSASYKITSSESFESDGSDSNLTLQGVLIQGALIRGKLPPKSAVWLNQKPLKILDNGDFVFGFGRDAKLSHKLEWQLAGSQRKFERSLVLKKREYEIERIDGVESKYVSPPPEVLSRIRSDNQLIGSARRTNSALTAFSQDFILPAQGRISGVYGSQRVFNGEPRRPHFGLDIAGPVGTPIMAPIDGVVSLAHTDMYYSGGTLIIDHGLGVSSTFIHLSSLNVKEGDVVKQGQKIAEMGATGRVTGPHLDWRINWFLERLDPGLLVDLTGR